MQKLKSERLTCSDSPRVSETNKLKTKNVYKMAQGTFKGAKRTDRECYECEDGEFLDLGTEIVCNNCHYSPDGKPTVEKKNPWEDFWEERENYSGFTGRNRVRMVGGFIGAFIDHDGRLRI